jgi:hypothetical protein
MFNLQGGTLAGTGYVYADLTNAGRLQVGGAGVAGYLLIFGNYTQTATGILEIDLGGLIAGGNHDLFIVAGAASLSGTLTVSLLNPYRPNPDDAFNFLFATGGITGDFTTFNGMNLGGGLGLLPFHDGFGYYLYAYLS